MSETQELEDVVEADRYLIFRLGEELYGTALLGVREVGEPLEPKPVPNTQSYFLGVINIRGQIVGVVDLRLRFGHQAKKTVENALMVFETESGPMAAIVDRVEAVVKLPEEKIERKPNVKTNVPHEFLIGVGHNDGRLVTLVDLNSALGKIDLRG